jgi:hypothetical protein
MASIMDILSSSNSELVLTKVFYLQNFLKMDQINRKINTIEKIYLIDN